MTQLALLAPDALAALTIPPDDFNCPCEDCGQPTTPQGRKRDELGRWEFYMLRFEVWQEAGGARFLCVGCIEARLGRLLCADDFAPPPPALPGLPEPTDLNTPSPWDTPRLADRKRRQGPNA
jgi:hypothetical protein